MNWKTIKEEFPPIGEEILYYDQNCTFLAAVTGDKEIKSFGFYCNQKDCKWIYDDCGCKIKVKDDDVWMLLPETPSYRL